MRVGFLVGIGGGACLCIVASACSGDSAGSTCPTGTLLEHGVCVADFDAGGGRASGGSGSGGVSGTGGASAGGVSGSDAAGGGGREGGGGSGASGGSDAGSGGAGGLDASPDGSCTGARVPLTPRTLPVDLIWAVDTSGSMLEEAQAVQNTVNGVARAIIDAGLDVHMVMLANPPFCVGGDAGVCTPGICVPAPLGSGRCPEDSNPPRFFHHPTAVVISNDAALVLVNSFAGYRNVLRASSRKHLFVVTDDDSTGEDAGVYADDAARFIADYTALDPMFVDASGRGPTWRMSAMYAATECPNALRVGHVWKAIVDQTGGAHADICACAGTQPQSCTQAVQQWSSAVTSRIVADAQADCEWAIPAPPPGQTLDVDDVNVEFTASPGGARTILPRVTGAAACNAQGGWYFDNPVTPTTILACPASCAAVKAATQGEVTLHVRCRAR